jgi:hypothetical protein
MTLPLAVLPDPAALRAVLIGVTTYEHESMDPLPAVAILAAAAPPDAPARSRWPFRS